MKDLIIIGGGPAGLTAGIYGIRAGLDLIIIEKISPGGQVVNSYEIENYPGFANPISGWDLMEAMEEQTRRLGAEIISAEVVAVKKDAGFFTVKLSDGEIQGKCVIVAAGTANRKLNIPGEKEYLGRGVSYCATCDGAFFKEKITVVVGGGDAALEEADFLTRFADKVYLVHRRDQFRGAEILQRRVSNNKKIIPVLNTIVESINGEGKVGSVILKDNGSGETKKLDTDGVFVFVGFDPNSAFLDDRLLNANREIIVDASMQTEIPGLFAAGDIRSGSKRQIVTAAADGATAALNAYEYLKTN